MAFRSEIQKVRDQLYVDQAEGKYLSVVGSNRGWHRPWIGYYDDTLWRSIIFNNCGNPKQVLVAFEDFLTAFLGPRYTKATNLRYDTTWGDEYFVINDPGKFALTWGQAYFYKDTNREESVDFDWAEWRTGKCFLREETFIKGTHTTVTPISSTDIDITYSVISMLMVDATAGVSTTLVVFDSSIYPDADPGDPSTYYPILLDRATSREEIVVVTDNDTGTNTLTIESAVVYNHYAAITKPNVMHCDAVPRPDGSVVLVDEWGGTTKTGYIRIDGGGIEVAEEDHEFVDVEVGDYYDIITLKDTIVNDFTGSVPGDIIVEQLYSQCDVELATVIVPGIGWSIWETEPRRVKIYLPDSIEDNTLRSASFIHDDIGGFEDCFGNQYAVLAQAAAAGDRVIYVDTEHPPLQNTLNYGEVLNIGKRFHKSGLYSSDIYGITGYHNPSTGDKFLCPVSSVLCSYRINETGLGWEWKSGIAVSGATDICSDERFVYVSRATTGVSSYVVDKDGNFVLKDTQKDTKAVSPSYQGVCSDGTYVYCAALNDGVKSYSVSNAGIFGLISQLDDGNTYYDVWTDGAFLFCAAHTQVHSYSIAAGNLALVSSDACVGSARGIWSDGTFAYVASTSGIGLVIYSIAAGVLTWTDASLDGSYADVMGDGSYVYVVGTSATPVLNVLRAYSISPLGAPTLVATITLPSTPYSIWIDDTFIYVGLTSISGFYPVCSYIFDPSVPEFIEALTDLLDIRAVYKKEERYHRVNAPVHQSINTWLTAGTDKSRLKLMEHLTFTVAAGTDATTIVIEETLVENELRSMLTWMLSSGDWQYKYYLYSASEGTCRAILSNTTDSITVVPAFGGAPTVSSDVMVVGYNTQWPAPNDWDTWLNTAGGSTNVSITPGAPIWDVDNMAGSWIWVVEEDWAVGSIDDVDVRQITSNTISTIDLIAPDALEAAPAVGSWFNIKSYSVIEFGLHTNPTTVGGLPVIQLPDNNNGVLTLNGAMPDAFTLNLAGGVLVVNAHIDQWVWVDGLNQSRRIVSNTATQIIVETPFIGVTVGGEAVTVKGINISENAFKSGNYVAYLVHNHDGINGPVGVGMGQARRIVDTSVVAGNATGAYLYLDRDYLGVGLVPTAGDRCLIFHMDQYYQYGKIRLDAEDAQYVVKEYGVDYVELESYLSSVPTLYKPVMLSSPVHISECDEWFVGESVTNNYEPTVDASVIESICSERGIIRFAGFVHRMFVGFGFIHSPCYEGIYLDRPLSNDHDAGEIVSVYSPKYSNNLAQGVNGAYLQSTAAAGSTATAVVWTGGGLGIDAYSGYILRWIDTTTWPIGVVESVILSHSDTTLYINDPDFTGITTGDALEILYMPGYQGHYVFSPGEYLPTSTTSTIDTDSETYSGHHPAPTRIAHTMPAKTCTCIEVQDSDSHPFIGYFPYNVQLAHGTHRSAQVVVNRNIPKRGMFKSKMFIADGATGAPNTLIDYLTGGLGVNTYRYQIVRVLDGITNTIRGYDYIASHIDTRITLANGIAGIAVDDTIQIFPFGGLRYSMAPGETAFYVWGGQDINGVYRYPQGTIQYLPAGYRVILGKETATSEIVTIKSMTIMGDGLTGYFELLDGTSTTAAHTLGDSVRLVNDVLEIDPVEYIYFGPHEKHGKIYQGDMVEPIVNEVSLVSGTSFSTSGSVYINYGESKIPLDMNAIGDINLGGNYHEYLEKWYIPIPISVGDEWDDSNLFPTVLTVNRGTSSEERIAISTIYTEDYGVFELHIDEDIGASTFSDSWCDGTYVYCAMGVSGLYVFKFVEDKLVPVAAADHGGIYHGVIGDGTYIYCACHGDGLRAYHFDEITLELSEIDTHFDGGGDYQDLYAHNGVVFVAADLSGVHSYTFDGVTLTLRDTSDQGGTYWDVYAQDRFVFCACGNQGLSVDAYDFDNHVFYQLDQVYAGSGDYCGVYGDGTYIHCGCWDRNIRAYSFDGQALTQVGLLTYGVGIVTNKVHWDGNYIHLSLGADGSRIMKFDGASYSVHNEWDDGDTYTRMNVYGDYVFYCAGADGLRVLTINPILVIDDESTAGIHGHDSILGLPAATSCDNIFIDMNPTTTLEYQEKDTNDLTFDPDERMVVAIKKGMPVHQIGDFATPDQYGYDYPFRVSVEWDWLLNFILDRIRAAGVKVEIIQEQEMLTNPCA